MWWQAVNPLTFGEDLATCAGQKSGDQIKKCGLSRAIRAYKTSNGSALNLKRTVVYCTQSLEIFNYILYIEDGHTVRHSVYPEYLIAIRYRLLSFKIFSRILSQRRIHCKWGRQYNTDDYTVCVCN
jgi:hypothetical protein